jgi:beta-glucanase (GH16 family)
LIVSVLISTGCGPAFKATTYGKSMFGSGGGPGSGSVGPILNEPSLPPNANIVRNPTFDQDLLIWEDWGGSSLLMGGAFSGNSAVRISGGDQGGVGQEVIFRVKTGAVYMLRAQAKVAATTDEVYLGVRFFNLTNGTISDQRVRITSTTYQPHVVNITVPTGASSAKVYVWKESTANSFADFDDFTMTMTTPPDEPDKEFSINNPNNYRPSGPAGNYTLVFDESFNGSALSSTYWNTGLWFTTTINNELQAYRPENAVVYSGTLKLVSESRTAQTTWGDQMNYASGAITTKDKFMFTTGIVEARARLPSGAGLHSLFYLEPYNKRAPPEINFMQALGQPTSAGFNYKFYDINGTVRSLSGTTNAADYADTFHTFTVEWTTSAVRFYVDGVLRGAYTGDSILRDEVFIVLSQAVGGATAGSPAGTAFPQNLEVDYIRVWQ